MYWKFFLLSAMSLVTLGVAGPSFAHEFILKPAQTRVSPGNPVGVQAQAAHVFMISEEAENPATVVVTRLQHGTSSPITLTEDPEHKTLAGTFTVQDSSPALLVGHRLPQIWSDTTEGVLEGNREQLTAKGKKVLSVGAYEKFAKTLINPATGNTLFQEKQGHDLEIILLNNPADLKAGDTLSALVLYKGQPIAAPLGLTYDGYSDQMDTYAAKSMTDAAGKASFTLAKPGLYMLRAEHTEKRTDGIDKRNLRATYVFPIQ